MTGYSPNSSNLDDYVTIAYDAATGTESWSKRYNGPGNTFDDATALTVSPAGTMVYVTGTSRGPTNVEAYATVAYDASTGAKIWTQRYNGPVNSASFPVALAVNPSGASVYVAGYTVGSTSDYDYATIAYDASTGAKTWIKLYNGPENSDDRASALAVSPEGTRIFVTGFRTGSTTGYDYATIAYET